MSARFSPKAVIASDRRERSNLRALRLLRPLQGLAKTCETASDAWVYFKHLTRWLVSICIFYSGLLKAWRWWKETRSSQSRFIVLRYHRVHDRALEDPFHLSVSPGVFRKQMRFLKRRYRVRRIEQCIHEAVVVRKKGRGRVPVAITFDDGYRDNFTQAYPILKHYDIPAIVFVSAGMVGKEKMYWWDEIESVIGHASKKRFELTWQELGDTHYSAVFDISTPVKKKAVLQRLEAICNRVDDQEQKRIMACLRAEMDGMHEEKECHAFSWEEAKTMALNGIEIGSHGVDHLLLTRTTRSQAEFEMEESKRKIEAELEKPVKYFAFPGGEIAPWMYKALKRAGYALSFSTEAGENTSDLNLLHIRRRAIHESVSVDPWGRFSKAMFALAVEGFFEKKDSKDLNGQKIKLLYVIDKLTRAGSQQHLIQLIRTMDRDLFDVEVICMEQGGPLEKALSRLDVNCEVIGVKNWNSVLGFWGFLKLLWLVHKFSPHVLHAYLFTANFFSPLAGKLLNVPVIITSRRDLGDWMSKRQIWMNRFTNGFVDLVTANSLAVRKSVIDLEGARPDKIAVVHNGIDPEGYISLKSRVSLRNQLNVPEKAVVLGTVGNIRMEKDPITLIRAFKKVSDECPEMHLIYAGRVKDHALKELMDQWILKHDIKDRIHFLGSIKNVSEILALLDIFVFTSRSEGFPNAILEAMAASVPVVASRVGGNVEQVVDGKTGFLFPVGDEHACAGAIRKLLSTDLRKEMGREGHRRLVSFFNERKMCRKIVLIYQDLLRSKCFNVPDMSDENPEEGKSEHDENLEILENLVSA